MFYVVLCYHFYSGKSPHYQLLPGFCPQTKDTHTVCSFSNCPRTQLLGFTISYLEKCALNNIFISTLPTCPKLYWLVPNILACGSGHRPQLVQRPHMAAGFFSLQSMAETPPLLPCICLFLLGPGSPTCTFCPAIGSWPSLLTSQEPIR